MTSQYPRHPATFWRHFNRRPEGAPLHCTNCGEPVTRQTAKGPGWKFRYKHSRGQGNCRRSVELPQLVERLPLP